MPQHAHISLSRSAWRAGAVSRGTRIVPQETPIALSYCGGTYAVMMATPADLEDFAVGFSLSEGIIAAASGIEAMEAVEIDGGIDLQIRIGQAASQALTLRRRALAGPVGCGLCGVESIEAALKPRAPVAENPLQLQPSEVCDAVRLLANQQPLNAMTHAVHAAGLYVPGEGMKLVREDVGRHNALDKLVGAMAVADLAANSGAIVLTSRVSVEMVQKTAACGCCFILAVSAPTALAIRAAEIANITLVALVRGADFDVYTHQHRINPGKRADVA